MKKALYIFAAILSISVFGYLALQNFGFTKETIFFFIVISWYLFHAFAPHHIREKIRWKIDWPRKKRLIKIVALTVLGFILFLFLLTKEMWF